MKKRRLKYVFFTCTLSLSLGIIVACNVGGGTSSDSTLSTQSSSSADLGERELTGFSIEKTTDVGELGSVYSVEEIAPVDNYGTFYDVDVSVKKDGQDILVIGDAFGLDELGEYVITYAIAFQDETLSHTTKVTVEDTSVPVIEINNLPEKIQQGDIVDLSGIVARDWSAIQTVTKAVTLGGQTIELQDDTFTATANGVYQVCVSAEDAAGNTGECVFFVNCMKKGELYNFESSVSAAEIYGATTMEYVDTLPEGNTSGGLKMTFAKNWQTLLFRDVNSQTLAGEIENGFNTLFFDVYYEGEDNEDIWITPFGTSPKNMRANEWRTFEIPLSAFAAVENKIGYIAFNIDGNSNYPQSTYTVYLDNIRVEKVLEKEKLYGGFENDTAENQGWRHIAWFTNIQVFTAQKDIVYEGMKSLKIVSSVAENYFHLTNGSGQTKLDNAWITERTGKTLSFWVYYKNETATEDTLTLNVKDGKDGAVAACTTEIEQGVWTQVVVNIDDMQDFSLITFILQSDNLASGAVYFDLFEVYEAE